MVWGMRRVGGVRRIASPNAEMRESGDRGEEQR